MISNIKPEPAFKGYNHTKFRNGIPTSDIIGKNCSRTVYERSKPELCIFYPYEPFKTKNKELLPSLTKYMDKINWGLPICIPSKEMSVAARNELSNYLRQFENLIIRYYLYKIHKYNVSVSYFLCFEPKNEQHYKAIDKFIDEWNKYLEYTNQKPFRRKLKMEGTHILEYNKKQNAFHIHTKEDAIKYRNKDWAWIFCGTSEECCDYMHKSYVKEVDKNV